MYIIKSIYILYIVYVLKIRSIYGNIYQKKINYNNRTFNPISVNRCSCLATFESIVAQQDFLPLEARVFQITARKVLV